MIFPQLKSSILRKLTIICIFTAIVGSMLDMTTTKIGLSLPHVIETNEVVVSRMNEGTWVLWDIMITGFVIFIVVLFVYKYRNSIGYFYLPALVIYGTFRILCAVNNIDVIMRVLCG